MNVLKSVYTEYVPALNMSYKADGNKAIVFEDGTVYTINELIHIAKTGVTDEDSKAIHIVKKTFAGFIDCPNYEILTPEQVELPPAKPGPVLPGYVQYGFEGEAIKLSKSKELDELEKEFSLRKGVYHGNMVSKRRSPER